MKPVRFVGTAKDDLGAFPKSARIRAGHELFMVQAGRDPDDWKPMSDIGTGVYARFASVIRAARIA